MLGVAHTLPNSSARAFASWADLPADAAPQSAVTMAQFRSLLAVSRLHLSNHVSSEGVPRWH